MTLEYGIDMLSHNFGKDCPHTLRNNPEERGFHLIRGGRLKPRTSLLYYIIYKYVDFNIK